MRKADRERQKMEAKREAQRIAAAERKAKAMGIIIQTKGLKKYVLQQTCGCCDAEVWFASEERLKAQLEAVGLQVSATIRDDLGQEVGSIDTFYGYRLEKEDRRGLGYLIGRLAAGN